MILGVFSKPNDTVIPAASIGCQRGAALPSCWHHRLPVPCSHRQQRSSPAPLCSWIFIPSAGFERLVYFWPVLEVLVKTCQLLAFPGRKGSVLSSPALPWSCWRSGSALGEESWALGSPDGPKWAPSPREMEPPNDAALLRDHPEPWGSSGPSQPGH